MQLKLSSVMLLAAAANSGALAQLIKCCCPSGTYLVAMNSTGITCKNWLQVRKSRILLLSLER